MNMGQVVVNCEEAMDFVMVQGSENGDMGGGSGSGSGSMSRWDLSNSIRVLLVEADDSTRHIIGALLRKCNYKVASVSDGLKAWELLKTRHDTIDLVLTEVELPSISGYALLTLIREHEFCKNIPVIMTSSHDSVDTVYKCMLKGAADFLVKPIRINELKNLWQHVWRRQSVCPRQEECIKKPDLVADSSFSNKTEEKSQVFDLKVQDSSNWDNSSQNLYPKAIDLMGNFDDNRSRRNWYSNDESTNKFDCSQRLDLSLRRYQPGALEISTTHEKQTNHSNNSAFTQYVNDSNTKDADNVSDINNMSQSTNLEKEVENQGLHRLFPTPFPAMSPRVCSPTSTSQSPRVSSHQSMSEQEQRSESSEDGSSNRTETQSNVSDAVVPGVSDSGSEQLYCERSILRKAALTKFRLKRKERCFDKKVRYESRKKLAEQRPRVKGQFVRQAPCDPSTNRV